jgi:2-oxo-4-hydroxy-4-carboxy-5-ureidoimidazoline decarboxylase
VTLVALNALTEEEAVAAFLTCCGSTRWAREMARRRPYRSQADVHIAVHEVWWELDPEDWDEAFRAHPRIGERKAAPAQSAQAAAWSMQEQAGAAAADDEIAAALAEGNRAYEERFGRIYIVCASGKTGKQLLRILRARLQNDPDTELRVAAAEQVKITELRLEKLFDP